LITGTTIPGQRAIGSFTENRNAHPDQPLAALQLLGLLPRQATPVLSVFETRLLVLDLRPPGSKLNHVLSVQWATIQAAFKEPSTRTERFP
jgi:hypothetical protein